MKSLDFILGAGHRMVSFTFFLCHLCGDGIGGDEKEGPEFKKEAS